MSNSSYPAPNTSQSGMTLSASITPQAVRERISEAEGQISVLEQELICARETIRSKNEEIAVLQEEIESLRFKVEALQSRVSRQEVTIRNQSKTIQDPRSSRARLAGGIGGIGGSERNHVPSHPPGLPVIPNPQPYTMSFRNYPGYPNHPLFMSQAQPQQSLRGSPHPHTHQQLVHPMYQLTINHSPWSGQNPSVHGTYHFPTNSNGDYPVADQPELDKSGAGARLQGLFMPMAQLREPSPQTMNAQRPLHQGLQNTDERAIITATSKLDPSYAGIEFEKNVGNIAGRLRALWIKSDQLAKTCGLGEDMTLYPEQLCPRLEDFMMVPSTVDIEALYINNPVLKKLYVAKVVNFYICKHILKYNEVVRGCDPTIDNEISSCRRRITHEITSTAKHLVLRSICQRVAQAIELPQFGTFCQQYRQNHTDTLHMLLEPLLSPKWREAARQKLFEIVCDAHKFAIELYSTPYDVRCHFPEMEEAYDRTVMINLDAEFDVALEKNAKIKMSVTPVIRLGNNEFQPARVRNVSLAKVYTSLPGSKEETTAGSGRTPGRRPRR